MGDALGTTPSVVGFAGFLGFGEGVDRVGENNARLGHANALDCHEGI